MGGWYSLPSYCVNCAIAYPWTGTAIEAAKALADELDELNETEKETMKGSIEDMLKDTANTPVAATRFRKLMTKAGRGAAVAFERILIEIMSETAKKIVYPTTP